MTSRRVSSPARGTPTASRVAPIRSVSWTAVLALAACSSPAREGVDEKFNFFPLARYEVSAAPPGYSFDALWPLVNAWRAGDASGSRALPLYVHEDDGEGERFTNVALLYWQTLRDDGDVRRDLFPIWHYVREENEHATRLWPLYGVRSWGGPDHPNRSDTLLWPLFHYDRARDGSWSELSLAAAWPLFALFHREDRVQGDPAHGRTETSFVSLLGDLVHVLRRERSLRPPDESREEAPEEAPADDDLARDRSDDATRERSGEDAAATASGRREAGPAGPIAPGTTIRNEWTALEVGELFRLWESDVAAPDGRARHHLLTLFDEVELSLFRWDDLPASESSWRHLFPLWFQHRDPTSSYLWLLPLFGDSRDGTHRRTWIVPPLLGLEDDPAREFSALDVLYPLVRRSTEGTGERRETHFRALPLAWFTWRPDSSVRLLLPLYYDIRDAHSRYTHLVPLYGENEERDGRARTTFVLAPLFIRHEDDDEALTQTHVLFPLIEATADRDGAMSRAFPLYYRRAGEDGAHLNVLGVFDRRRESDGWSRTLLYPLFSSESRVGGGSTTSLLPLLDLRLLDDARPQADEVSVLFPLSSFRSRESGATSRWIFPLWWQFEDPDAESSIRHLWPLLGRHARGSRVTWATLWPLFFRTSDRDDPEMSELGYLFPLGYAWSDAAETRNWLLPLWYHHAEGDEATSWALWPLFHRERTADATRWHSLFYLLRSETTAAAHEFSVLYALYRGRTEGDRTTRSVPFLFHFEDDGGARTLRLFHLIPIRW